MFTVFQIPRDRMRGMLTTHIEGGEAMHEDSQIITLLNQRDESALDIIKAQYGESCFQIAYRMTGSREDAEECVSDMLLHVWNSVPPNTPAHLQTYLSAIVRRNAVNRWKQEHRRKRGGTQLNEVIEELADILPSPEQVEQRVEQRELTAALNAWCRTLPEEHRQIFMERYFLSESVKTLAEKHGISEGAVKMLLLRIRTKLREHLNKEGLL